MSGPGDRFLIAALALPIAAQAAPPTRIIASIDLAGPFATAAPWRLVASQGADVPANLSNTQEPEPGAIRLCVTRDKGRTCPLDLSMAGPQAPGDYYVDGHFLEATQIVRPRGAHQPPILLIRTASLHGGNGDQAVATQALAYDRKQGRFFLAFKRDVLRNTNDEIRYIAAGPLRGAIVSAEPTHDAPFGYWIAVDRLTPAYRYAQVLRYRSATRYDDGNPLAVIDSEMPNIQRRLGLWKPGEPLPLPPHACLNPTIIRTALWCYHPKGK